MINCPGALATMTAGAVGGVALWTFIFPADVVKSRMQISHLRGSFYENTASIVRNEGKFFSLSICYHCLVYIYIYCQYLKLALKRKIIVNKHRCETGAFFKCKPPTFYWASMPFVLSFRDS